ncbi:MAG: hypothetical protein KH135_04570 [Firmicutes bacterium]|nr:hypothetical protein [Bacillota bacterium]
MDYDKFLKHVLEYKRYLLRNQKPLAQTSTECFLDGTRIGIWYNAYFTIYKNTRKKKTITELEEKFCRDFENLREWVIFFKQVEKRNEENAKLKVYEQKVKAYCLLTESIKMPIEERDAYQFFDGKKMGLWYNQQNTKFQKMLKNKIPFSPYESLKYQQFLKAKEVRQQYELCSEKYNEKRLEQFTNHVNCYLELLKEEKRKIPQTDTRRFEDGTRIGTWYYRKNQIIKEWRSENRQLTKEQMLQLMEFSKIDLLEFETKETTGSQKTKVKGVKNNGRK